MVINLQHYREKVSQMISWGHWFALFNILLVLLVGSRYPFLADWPSSLLGRIYALISLLGHFSFVVFVGYLLVIFPITFVVMSEWILRFIATSLATAWLTLLLVDSEVFSRFHLHLNSIVWVLLSSPNQSELVRNWQWISIYMLLIFFVEMLLSTWIWQKLRSLNRHYFGQPLAVLFICAFLASHLIYIWADANFYRPITMQRANLPLSYPMTARKFLEKHGLLNQQIYNRHLIQHGHPESVAIEYPFSDLRYNDKGSGYNLLMIIVDSLRPQDMHQYMPVLTHFAQTNIQFTNHYSSGYYANTGLFGLFYGISSTYVDNILASRIPSALVNALSTQGYRFVLCASGGFSANLYRQALLTDFSLPISVKQSDKITTEKWQSWLLDQDSKREPWFSYINFSGTALPANSKMPALTNIITRYYNGVQDVDTRISQILDVLKKHSLLNKTVLVITAEHGIQFNNTNKDLCGSGFSQSQLHVPLIIHWPGKSAQIIYKLTGHNDVMRTLMQHLLHVSTAPKDYSQGEDLFTSKRNKNWIATGDSNRLIVTTLTKTLMLDNNGVYHAYDKNGKEIKEERPRLHQLLEVLTDVKRFIVN